MHNIRNTLGEGGKVTITLDLDQKALLKKNIS